MTTSAPVQSDAPHKPDFAKMVHIVIGLLIMVSGYFLPQISKVVPANEKLIAMGLPVVDGQVTLQVTEMGMIITMTFLAVVYLWTFVDTIWPSLLGIAALIFSNYAPAPKILSMFLGNPMVVMIFFLCIFASAIVHSGLASWIARFLTTREFVNGRPWVFTATLLLTTYIVAFFDQTTAVFLMWPVLYAVFEQAGFRKGDKYVSIMVVYICIMALLSFASDPFKGGAFYLVSNLQSIAATSTGLNAEPLDLLAYFSFAQVVSLTSIAILLLLMRFVFRVDVSPLKNINTDMLRREPLPPMSPSQKVVLFTFLGYALWLLLPSIIGTDNAVGAFLQKNNMTGSLMAVLAISVIFIKGKPAIDITLSNAHFPLRVFLLIAVAMLLGGIMTGKGTNVALVMEYTLRDLLTGMDYTMLTVAVAGLGIVLTNFCNSVVLGLMLTPVLLAVSNAFGYSSGPIMACFIYAVLIAACTPAASPFAALLFGQTRWASTGVMIKHAVIASAVVYGVVVCVGMPLAFLIF
ncbi:MAG TPA: hypothetical protein H9894_03365 [Candidatus Desulfovibrio intestinipullorum]|uniref:Citrate transporter-like domain-containing protein n=1 Tax=Candidatus Desulfovibrio intestinipullorum TaxID=2838536 RepID=A0A9D1PX29_9BACT|nr:hypothetical protein [Candidatus Desulfovibrio intestinipullorum]